MKKLILLLCLLILTLTTTSFATTWNIMQVTVSGARMRKGPGNYDIISTLHKGTKVLSMQKANKAYYKILTQDGKVGYVFRDHVEKIGSVNSDRIYKTTESVVLRKQPNVKSSRVKSLSGGQLVYVQGTDGEWACVKTVKGKTGYVKVEYLGK